MLIEELVLGDLIREIGLDSAYKVGYYEGHRLWSMFDELRAGDLQKQWRVMDAANATEEYRGNVKDWLESSQPRRYPAQQEIPKEIMDRIQKAWDAEG